MNYLKTKARKFLKKEELITEEIAKNLKNKPFLAILNVFTEIGSSMGAIVIFITLAFVSGYKTLSFFIPVYLLQLIAVEFIKVTFKRPRPKQHGPIKNIFGLKATSGSFPSGHSSNIFSIALLLSYYYQTSLNATSILFAIAALVGLSRIYLGKHYIVDVTGGAVIGLILSTIGILTMNLI